jgi:hypothetical protein
MTEREHIYKPMRKALPGVDWLRIENLVGEGMADINGCLKGVEAWIETKIVNGNQIRFQPFQPAWLINRLAHGGRAFVLARKDDELMLWGGLALNNLLRLVEERGDKLVVDHRLVLPSLALLKPFNWSALSTIIFHEAQ